MATLEITDDTLATDWTLSESDIATVWDCCRGAEHGLSGNLRGARLPLFW